MLLFAVLAGATLVIVLVRSGSLWTGVYLVLLAAGIAFGSPLGVTIRVGRLLPRALTRDQLGAVETAPTEENRHTERDRQWVINLRNAGAVLAIIGALGLALPVVRLLLEQAASSIPAADRPASSGSAEWVWWQWALHLLLGVLLIIGGIGICRLKEFGRILILTYCALGAFRCIALMIERDGAAATVGFSCLVLLWYAFLTVMFARKDWRSPPHKPGESSQDEANASSSTPPSS